MLVNTRLLDVLSMAKVKQLAAEVSKGKAVIAEAKQEYEEDTES